MRLYSAQSRPLFHWSGLAKTPFDADKLARSKYAEALEAIFRAQGLTRADASAKLSVAESEVLGTPSANAWRVTHRASWDAEGHRNARRVLLGKALADDIARSVAMSDHDCIAALQLDYSLELGMWLTCVGKEGLLDVDSCWLVSGPSGTVRVPHASSLLRDVLRLFVLRALSPRHEIGNPKSHPFNGFRIPIFAQSKVLLAFEKSRTPAAPAIVLNWLEGDGFAEVAKRYRESF